MLEKAIATAAKHHAGQYRKGIIHGHQVPYIVHPIEVMKRVWTWGAGEELLLTAAVLHDTLEDTDLTYEQLAQEFGEEVAGLVKELTYDPASGQTKAEYLGRFATASVPALVIKLADRYCNTHDHMLTDPKYAKRYLEKARVLVDALHRRLPEIIAVFREDTGEAIVADYDRLEESLGIRQPSP